MTNQEILFKAVIRLVEDASFNLDGENYSDIIWTDERDIPSEESVLEKIQEIKDELLLSQNNRSNEYPSLEDQLDALWHSMNIGLIPKAENFYEMIKEVKDKYPKPE